MKGNKMSELGDNSDCFTDFFNTFIINSTVFEAA